MTKQQASDVLVVCENKRVQIKDKYSILCAVIWQIMTCHDWSMLVVSAMAASCNL